MKHIFYILILLLATTSIAQANTQIINTYDANGSLISGDGNFYEYNEANQLVRVRQGDQNGEVVAEYFYDYTGQRIKKVEHGVTTYYVGGHFEKQSGGSDDGNTSYYFAEGERIAKKDPSGNIYFYHSDHLGGTNAVTDSTGTVVAKTDYLPFGDIKHGSTGNEKYSYTGKEKDKTDLYYFEARYNSPMFKHFTQADVASPDLSDPQDLNRYSYVGNNPMSYVDPDGFKKKKKSKKKKAKLSKREKWMIAHGIDPDKDKTSLKEAKKKYGNSSNQIVTSTISANQSNAPASAEYFASKNSRRDDISNQNNKQTGRQIVHELAYKLLPNADDREIAGELIKIIPFFGPSTVFAYEIDKYRNDGKDHTLSDTWSLSEKIPYGIGWELKRNRIYGNDILYHVSGGKYGKAKTWDDFDDLIGSTPFYIGFVYKSGKYTIKQVEELMK